MKQKEKVERCKVAAESVRSECAESFSGNVMAGRMASWFRTKRLG